MIWVIIWVTILVRSYYLDWNVYELENGKGVHKTPLECSARNKDGVREVFETATRAALQMKKKRKKKFCTLI